MAKTILIVDDDRLIRRSLELYLREAGYTVIQAENGQAGLEAALAHHPDLIISDMRMAELDGLEMVKKIREDEWGKSARVILMSTDEEIATVNNALKAGITTYLSKSALTPDKIAEQAMATLK